MALTSTAQHNSLPFRSSSYLPLSICEVIGSKRRPRVGRGAVSVGIDSEGARALQQHRAKRPAERQEAMPLSHMGNFKVLTSTEFN